MPGARIGFAISSADIIDDMNKIKFAFNPFNMSTLAIVGGAAAIRDKEYFHKCIEKVEEVREEFEDELEEMGFGVIRTTTNFAFFHCPDVPATILCKELKKRGILVRHYNDERINDYLRITIGTREEMRRVLVQLNSIRESVYDCAG